MMGVMYMGICQSIAASITQLIVFVSFVGIVIGVSVPIISVYLAEISPIQNRGRYFMYMCNSNPLGLLIIIIVAYFALDDIDSGDWRCLFHLISAMAALSFVISILYCFESPRYLAINDKVSECMNLLQLMAKRNSKPEINQSEADNIRSWGRQEFDRTKHMKASLRQLFMGDKAAITIKLGLMWLSLAFVYYGIIFQLPELLKRINATQRK